MASFYAQDRAGLVPETIRVWRYLEVQGCHFVLVNRDKVPIHRRWQLPWERPSLDKVLRHLAGGGLVGHVPAAVGCVVLDMDESDDDGSAFMDAHPPYWDIPSKRAGGLHLYYNSRVQYGNRNWRMGSAAGQLRSRNGFVVIWNPHDLADMLAYRSMSECSPEDEPFPAVALGARTQLPQDWGLRTPPPRREPAAQRRRPSKSALPGIEGTPRRTRESQEAGRPLEWVLREPPERLRAVRAPNAATGAPGARNCELFDAVRFFAYALPRGRGGPAMYAQWSRFILEYADSCNREFAVPLSDGDVEKTARSVARFTWATPSFGRPVDLGRWDSAVQRRRSRLGVLARQRRVVDRNMAIRAMREDGLGIRAIGREMDLSASQVCRVVQARVPVLHNPITLLWAASCWCFELGIWSFSEYDEIRNNSAAQNSRRNQSHTSQKNSLEHANITDNTDETTLRTSGKCRRRPCRCGLWRWLRESGMTVDEVLQLARDMLGTGWRIRLSGELAWTRCNAGSGGRRRDGDGKRPGSHRLYGASGARPAAACVTACPGALTAPAPGDLQDNDGCSAYGRGKGQPPAPARIVVRNCSGLRGAEWLMA